MTTAPTDPGLTEMQGRISAQWGWFVGLGFVLLLAGILAFANLLAATLVSVAFVGAMMIVGAIAQLIHAFRVKGWGEFFLWLLGAILYGVAGIFAFANPVLAAATLTLLLAVTLIASGFVRLWSGIRLRPARGWGWVAASGVISVIAGVVFLLGWPVNSLWLLGLALALDLLFQGVSAIALGFALKARA